MGRRVLRAKECGEPAGGTLVRHDGVLRHFIADNLPEVKRVQRRISHVVQHTPGMCGNVSFKLKCIAEGDDRSLEILGAVRESNQFAVPGG